jgi:hypothetical protein
MTLTNQSENRNRVDNLENSKSLRLNQDKNQSLNKPTTIKLIALVVKIPPPF